MTASTAPLPQIASLTSLRGLLALWVVFFHFWNDVLCLFPAVSVLSPVTRRGDFAVPSFFLLSGLVLARKYAPHFQHLGLRGVVHFLLLRLARIYPVHLGTLFSVLAMVAGSRYLGFVLSEGGYSVKQFFLNLLLVHAWTPQLVLSWNYPSWSISSEWFAYLLFPLLVRTSGPVLRTVRGAGSSFTVASALSITVLLLWGTLPYRELAVVVPTFFAGMAANQLAQLVHADGSRALVWLPMFIGLAVLASCYVPGTMGLALLLSALFALVLSLAVSAGEARYWAAPPLLLLGEVSYSLYMTHTLAQKLLYRVLPATRFAEGSAGLRLAVLATYTFLVALLCCLSFVLVERPCRRWGRRRFERAQSRTPVWSPSGILG